MYVCTLYILPPILVLLSSQSSSFLRSFLSLFLEKNLTANNRGEEESSAQLFLLFCDKLSRTRGVVSIHSPTQGHSTQDYHTLNTAACCIPHSGLWYSTQRLMVFHQWIEVFHAAAYGIPPLACGTPFIC